MQRLRKHWQEKGWKDRSSYSEYKKWCKKWWKYPASETNRIDAAKGLKPAGVRRKVYFLQDYKQGISSAVMRAQRRLIVVAAAIILMVPYYLVEESILGVLPTVMQQVLLLVVEVTLAGGVTWKGCSWFIEWMKYKWYRTTEVYLAWWDTPAEEK